MTRSRGGRTSTSPRHVTEGIKSEPSTSSQPDTRVIQPRPSTSSQPDTRGIQPGPVDTSVLWMQHRHRSSGLWTGEGDSEIKFRSSKPWPLDARVRHYVDQAGFGGAAQVVGLQLDQSLLQTLVERWRRETHTFHLRVGEMTVTLQDVAMLIGLPIDGRPVTDDPNTVHDFDMRGLCVRLLGLSPRDQADRDPAPAHREIDGNSINLGWLRDNFSNAPADDATVDVLHQHARAYILYLLGGMLLSGRKGDQVQGMYLPLLEDLEETRLYSWGSAVLAHLYAGLCDACMSGVKGMSGCAILLQLWSWEHLHMGRPQMIQPLEHVYAGPLGVFWRGPKSFKGTPKTAVRAFYRDELELQEPHQVIWSPYDRDRVNRAPIICVEGSDIWRSVVPLIHFHEVEWHRPDRVMRQFGFFQHIPTNIDHVEDELHGISRRGKVDEIWSIRHAHLIELWNARRTSSIAPQPAIHPRNYFTWYNRITRHFIIPPGTRARRPDMPQPQALKYQPRGSQYHGLMGILVDGTRRAARALREAPRDGTQVVAERWLEHCREMFVESGEPALYDEIVKSMGVDADIPSQTGTLQVTQDEDVPSASRQQKRRCTSEDNSDIMNSV